MAMRHYQGAADLIAMRALAASAAPEHLHVVDLPYRFSSWAFDDPANVALWESESGKLEGWCVLQSPFWSLDLCCGQDAGPALLAEMVEWLAVRARSSRGTGFERPAWFASVLDRQVNVLDALAAAGLTNQKDAENAWSKFLFLNRGWQGPSPQPAGFDIRPLAASEVPAYVALHRAVFQSDSMTTGWRERTLQHPAYRTTVDVGAWNSAGEMVGFAVGWLADTGQRKRPSGQVEPLGVREDCRKLGLGRGLLTECVRRLRTIGAEDVFVETDNFRDAAFNLYEGSGFQIYETASVLRFDP